MAAIALFLIMGAIVGAIAQSKGRSFVGWFAYGFLLFPIALIHVLVARRNLKGVEARELAEGDRRKCPQCAELIKAEAKVCRFCGRDVAAADRAPYEFG